MGRLHWPAAHLSNPIDSIAHTLTTAAVAVSFVVGLSG
jgi:hypothetical protein